MLFGFAPLYLCGAALIASGCATPGLRFEILQPPVLLGNTQSVVQSTGATISTQANGSFVSPLGMPETTMTMIPTTRISSVQTSAAPTVRYEYAQRTAGDCTLDDVCNRIKALEASRPIRIAPAVERLPMPAPKAAPAAPMPQAPCE